MLDAKAIIGVDRSSPEQISGIPAEPDSHNVDTGSAFKIQQMWVYTLEEEGPRDDRTKLGAPHGPSTLLSRDTVEIEMRYGEGRKWTHVPDNVNEEQMVQLLVSSFEENVRKKWQVKTRNMSQRVMEEYKLVPARSYELEPRQEAAPRPQSKAVQARTQYQGLSWDIELDASWNQRQVQEAVMEVWKDEWEKRGKPHTEIETRDTRNCRTKFMVHEGWIYVLQDRDLRGPEWLNTKEYTSTKRPQNPNEAVLIGLQLEDGMRIEHTVLAGTEETLLKRIMWQELSPRREFSIYTSGTRGPRRATASKSAGSGRTF
jgi:hypothetical protein